MILKWGKTDVSIVKGDIVGQDVDAIVNAANSTLYGGTGVDDAIHRAGGPQILEECVEIRRNQWPDGLPNGKAVLTSSGNLKARHVIHTVGPVWGDGLINEAGTLKDCYYNCLLLAKEKRLNSIAFPAISTGAYGYPIKDATPIALRTSKQFVIEHGWPREIIFVLFDDRALEIYEQTAKQLD